MGPESGIQEAPFCLTLGEKSHSTCRFRGVSFNYVVERGSNIGPPKCSALYALLSFPRKNVIPADSKPGKAGGGNPDFPCSQP